MQEEDAHSAVTAPARAPRSPGPLRAPAAARLATAGRARGFTLVELVVVIVILGALAAVAVPRFINLGTEARIAAVKTLASAVNSTAMNVHAMCALNPSCDYNSWGQALTIAGQFRGLNYGWPEAGDNIDGDQIDSGIEHSGFTVSLPSITTTRFTLDGSPDPTNCSVSYVQAANPSGPTITVATSGC